MAMRGFAVLLAVAVVGLEFASAQSPHHLARLDLNQAEDWAPVLAEFPRLEQGHQARVLRGLEGFLAVGAEKLLSERIDHGFPTLVVRQRQLLGLPKSEKEVGSRQVADASALGELAANALDYSLAKGSREVRLEAIEVAEALMPQFYVPEVTSGGSCGTGYDYLRGRFRFDFSRSLRAFASKNISWVEKVDPRDEVEGIKLLLRAHLRLPSAMSAIKQSLGSEDQGAIDQALLGVMQWPDQDFIPLLQRLIVVDDLLVRPYYNLTFAVVAYREKVAAVIEPVIGSLKHPGQWVEDLAYLPCKESWEFCLRLSRSEEAWARSIGVANIQAIAEGYWADGRPPKSAVPSDAKIVAKKVVAAALSDPNPQVRVAAVGAHDWSSQPEKMRAFANDPSPGVREQVANQISELPTEIRAELIWKLAGDSSLSVQEVVARVVGQGDDAGLEEPARKALSSPLARDRSAAALVLAGLGHDKEVLPLLKDRDPHVRASAVLAIGGHDDMDVEHILPLCGDEDSRVVQIALERVSSRYDLYEEQLKMLTKALALAKPQHAPLVQREIERVKRQMANDDDN